MITNYRLAKTQNQIAKRVKKSQAPDSGRNTSVPLYFGSRTRENYVGAVRVQPSGLSQLVGELRSAFTPKRLTVAGALVAAVGIQTVMSGGNVDKVHGVEVQPVLSANAVMQARRVVENFNSGGVIDLKTYNHALAAVRRDDARKIVLQEALERPCDIGSTTGTYRKPTCFEL